MDLFELKTTKIFLAFLGEFQEEPIINSWQHRFLFKLTPRSGISQVTPPVQPQHVNKWSLT